MNNNDVLRRLRFALNLRDAEVVRLAALSGQELALDDLEAYLAKEGGPGYVPCPDPFLGAFLDGLILDRRGPPKSAKKSSPAAEAALDNNKILKKIRIALDLQQDDMLAILQLGEMYLSASELTALFRKPGHKHHRPCGDQLLRRFLDGLTKNQRR